jgi:hypothetical protein
VKRALSYSQFALKLAGELDGYNLLKIMFISPVAPGQAFSF